MTTACLTVGVFTMLGGWTAFWNALVNHYRRRALVVSGVVFIIGVVLIWLGKGW